VRVRVRGRAGGRGRARARARIFSKKKLSAKNLLKFKVKNIIKRAKEKNPVKVQENALYRGIRENEVLRK